MENNKRICTICGSNNRVISTDIGLLCNKHYTQYKRYGCIRKRTKYDPNEIVNNIDNTSYIYLYDKIGEFVDKTIIDTEDVEKVSKFKWCKDKNGYVKNSKQEYLHRIILNEYALYIDHINGNTLDNRKSNLRVCSNSDNLKHRVKLASNNTSGIHGVIFEKRRNKWRVEIQANKIKHFIGYFDSIDDAAKARKEAEIKYFGKYKSNLNETN